MAEEKKYEITEKELEMYIGLAMANTIPKDATKEESNKLNEFASDLFLRIRDHLNGSNPFSEEEMSVYVVATSAVDMLRTLGVTIVENWEE